MPRASGGNEQVAQHRDPVDVDHTAIGDHSTDRLRYKQPPSLGANELKILRVCRCIAFACDRIHHRVIGRRCLPDPRWHYSI